MTDPHLIETAEESYSTRTCKRCSIAMNPRQGRRGRIWECYTCGRKAR